MPRRAISEAFETTGDLVVFLWRSLVAALRRPVEWRELTRHLHLLGVRSVPLVALAGLAVGIVWSMHTRAVFERFGAEIAIPSGLALALIRETGPLTTGLLVAGRAGASIGAELGSLRISEQIDALEALAVDSIKFLVPSRLVACVLILPILTTVINTTGLLGGFLAETMISGISLELFLSRAFEGLSFAEYLTATLKTCVFGFLIGGVSSYLGFHASGGSAGVGRATTQSVVWSSLLLIVVNVLLVRAISFLFPGVG